MDQNNNYCRDNEISFHAVYTKHSILPSIIIRPPLHTQIELP